MMKATNYYGKVRQGVLGTSKEKQTPYIAITVTMTHEAENGQWVNIPDTDRTIYWHLSDAAWPHTQKRLEAIGFTGSFDAIAFAGEAVDSGVQWTCTHEEYQGKTRAKWDLANWGGEKEHTPPATDQVRKFNALWKSDHAASQVPAGKPGPPPTEPQTTTVPGPEGSEDVGDFLGGDDIPF